MYIYPVEKLFEELTASPVGNLHAEAKKFIDLCKKEQKTEYEQKWFDDFILEYSREKWELNEYMIKKGIYN